PSSASGFTRRPASTPCRSRRVASPAGRRRPSSSVSVPACPEHAGSSKSVRPLPSSSRQLPHISAGAAFGTRHVLVWTHTPPMQASVVQTLLSLQSAAVAQGPQPAAEASGGQATLLPVQYSGTSHGSADGRHRVLAGTKPSGGHVLLVPSQASGTSHTPAAGRHTVPAGLFASAGQLALVPVQVSGGSQAPA